MGNACVTAYSDTTWINRNGDRLVKYCRNAENPFRESNRDGRAAFAGHHLAAASAGASTSRADAGTTGSGADYFGDDVRSRASSSGARWTRSRWGFRTWAGHRRRDRRNTRSDASFDKRRWQGDQLHGDGGAD